MFKNRASRNTFYEHRKKLKGTSTKDLEMSYNEEIPVFINKSLTAANRIFIQPACKEKIFKRYWTVNGKIMCNRTFQSTVITKKNEEDVSSLIK